MSSRFGTRTYTRQQKVCQSNIQFENAFSERANRPSASKSAGVLHKWGKTSFTSIRNSHLNGQKDVETEVKRPKLVVSEDDDPFSFEAESTETHNLTKVVVPVSAVVEKKPASLVPKPNKFFKSGNRGSVQTYSKRLAASKTVGSLAAKSGDTDFNRLRGDTGYSEKQDSPITLSGCTEESNGPSDINLKQMCLPDYNCSSIDSPSDVQNSVHSSRAASPVSDESQTAFMSSQPSDDYGQIDYLPYITKDKGSETSAREDDDQEAELVTKRSRRFFRTYSSIRPRDAAKDGSVLNTPASSAPSDSSPVQLPRHTNTVLSTSQSTVTSSQSSITTTQLEDGASSRTQSSIQDAWSKLMAGNSDSNSSESGSGSSKHKAASAESKTTWGVRTAATGIILTRNSASRASKVAEESSCSQQSVCVISSDASSSGGLKKKTESESQSSSLVVVVEEAPESMETDQMFSQEMSSQEVTTQEMSSQEMSSQEMSQEMSSQEILSSHPNIFSTARSRRIFNSPKKQIDKKKMYKHRPWQADEPAEQEEARQATSQPLVDEFEDSEELIAPLVRVTTWPTRIGDEAITSVRCSKKAREFYKVVRNVKQAHQCHESGETQEFNDDIEYLLDGLQRTIPLGTRCLSVLSLAAKCMVPGFRMHLRAHGTISKVFSALQDAPSDQNLSLCTASVMFILSQDRLNMDLERSSLELMLALLDTDSVQCTPTKMPTAAIITSSSSSQSEGRELERNLSKVRELCEEVQRKGHAHHLNLDNITSCHLAMETLLSLTSRRAGEWFKEELRELGGLDHLVETVSQCVRFFGKEVETLAAPELDKLSKIDRCLRVLESVTLMNFENQTYLVAYKQARLIDSILKVLRLCTSLLPSNPVKDKSDRESPGGILFNCLQAVLRVLLNLTHENMQGSARVGEQPGVLDVLLQCVFHMPKFIPVDQVFDLLVLTLGILINFVEHCTVNRQKLLEADVPPPSTERSTKHRNTSAVKALVDLFVEREELARQEEAKTDSLLDGNTSQTSEGGDGNGQPHPVTQDELEETLTKALQKAGKHMETSMVAAYVALLLGCVIQDGKDAAKQVRDQLPDHNFSIMVQILRKFFNFMSLTTTVSNTGMKSIQRVIDALESS